jgi:ribosome maturation factor RimP
MEPFLIPFTGDEERLRMIIEPVVSSQGLELVGLEWARGAQQDVVRLYLDKPGAGVTPGKGISMAEIEPVSRLLSDLLDAEDAGGELFVRPFELEIGSPGLDRPLTKRSHFALVAGQRIKIRLKGGHQVASKSRQLQVVLVSVADDILHTRTDAGELLPIAINDLETAQVQFRLANMEPQKPITRGRTTKPKAKR